MEDLLKELIEEIRFFRGELSELRSSIDWLSSKTPRK
jgi:hypothetical protein